MINYKKRIDFYKFEQILDKYNIYYLYHFTDKSNIQNIVNYGGLYSRDMCQKMNISFKPGGSQLSYLLDRRKNLTDYIRLSFNSKHPMMYVAMNDERKIDPVILKINREILFYDNCLFSNINAADNDSKIGSTFDDFTRIKFDIVTSSWSNETEKKYFQAEVLVKSYISIEFIVLPNDKGKNNFENNESFECIIL